MNNLKQCISDFFAIRKHRIYTIILTIVILLSIIALIFIGISRKRYDYPIIKEKMVSATIQYLNKNKEKKPDDENPSTIIEANNLISEGFLKDFSKLSKDTNCQGQINVIYNNGTLRYEPILNCDNYETKILKDVILNKEKIINKDSDGLYFINNTYVFKGDYVNNYVTFANQLWRLFKITDDEKLYLVLADTVNKKNSAVIFDDRYNEEAQGNEGKSDLETSRMYETLMNAYNNDFDSYKAYLQWYDVCKNPRSENDTNLTGAIECFTTISMPISLMAVYDYLNASRDNLCMELYTTYPGCKNYNYLSKTTENWWLINGTNENSYKVYYVDKNGSINLSYANLKKNLRYVIALPGSVEYKQGKGTKDDPYEINTYNIISKK